MGSPEYHEAQVVVVEEAQFFPDVYEFLSRESDVSGKEFLVSGLAGDYKRKPIGNVLALIPFAEYVDKLNGLCNRCRDKTPGCFTRRLIESVGYDQMVVGGRETYECVCRKHLMMDTDMMETEMPTET
jgi:thymidine kinase